MNYLESKEDYLERILMLSEKSSLVRAIDIANDMGFSKPSVSIALKKLLADSLISIEANGNILLTKDGLKIAKEVYEKHLILTKALLLLGVDEKTARVDACKIEHDISNDTFEKIKDYVRKLGNK